MDPFSNFVFMKTAYLILVKRGIMRVFLILYMIVKEGKYKK